MNRNYELTIEECGNYLDRVVSEGLNEIYELPADVNQNFIEIAYSMYPVMEAGGTLGPKGLALIQMLRQYNGITTA